MAFGITRQELNSWKENVRKGEIAFITHYWIDPRFPGVTSVTKVGCSDVERLIAWGKKYGIPEKYIHYTSDYPHFDLFGDRQRSILEKEKMLEQLARFL